MLSTNQINVMALLRERDGATLLEVAAAHISGTYPYGADAARQNLRRLETRELVAEEATGKFRLSSEGERELRAALGEAASPTRGYVMLEEIDLARLDSLPDDAKVYLQVGVVDARNTEHALKKAGNTLDLEVFDGRAPRLVPVAARYFQPQPVNVTATRRVSIG